MQMFLIGLDVCLTVDQKKLGRNQYWFRSQQMSLANHFYKRCVSRRDLLLKMYDYLSQGDQIGVININLK